MKWLPCKIAALMLSAVLLSVLLLSGCSSSSSGGGKADSNPQVNAVVGNNGGFNAADVADAADVQGARVAGEALADNAYESDVSNERQNLQGGADGYYVAGVNTDNPNLPEKIIYSANVTVETLDFDAALAGLPAYIKEYGGFVQQSDTNGPGITEGRYSATDNAGDNIALPYETRTATFVIRIPQDRFDDAVTALGDLGSVKNKHLSAVNVTAQYYDLQKRVDTLLIQEERLLAMLTKADAVEDMIALESRLSDVRYSIESVQAQQANISRDADYSTLTLNIWEVTKYTRPASANQTLPDRIKTAWAVGWDAFTGFLAGLVVVIVEIVPFLIIILPVGYIIRRLAKRKRAAIGNAGVGTVAVAAAADEADKTDKTVEAVEADKGEN